eukprot:1608751-Rhodomonas_salina.1
MEAGTKKGKGQERGNATRSEGAKERKVHKGGRVTEDLAKVERTKAEVPIAEGSGVDDVGLDQTFVS